MMEKNNSQAIWQQAKTLFAEYLDLPVEDSLAAVEKRTDIEPVVKERVVRLIKALEKSKTILQQADSGQIIQRIKQLSDMTGQHVDGYVLNELLAVGGMSSIYQAQRVDSEVQKPVAIKILSMQSDATDVVLLFNRELKALSKLNHQNIVAFYHGGESTSGIYYLVMELIEGAITLDQYIEQQHADVNQTVDLIQQVAVAMVNAHDHLIIHGDLKPENILVDVNHQVKVVDFGIAAFTYQNQQQLSPVYTPAVASPEQVLGASITVKSDVFSLGATLLQLLSKQSPQPGFAPNQYSTEGIQTHISGLLKDSNIDSDLGCIIKKAMHPDPTQRYITMHDFAADLTCWLKGRPVMAVQGGRLYHFKKFALRNKLLTTGSFLFIGILIAALVVVQIYAINAKNEAEKAKTTLDFMTSVLSQADPAHIDQGNTTIKEAFKITLNQSDEFLTNNPESQIEILTQVAEIYNELALYEEAASTAEKIHQAYGITEGPNSRNAMYWLYEAAGHYHAAGAFEKCLQLGHEVLEQLDQNQLSYPVVRLNALNVIIKCHVEKFENDLAYQYMNVAQQLMDSGKINDYESLGRTYNSFAVITRRQHQFELSEGFYQKSLLNIEKSLGKDNTAYATILNGFGRMYMLQDKYEVAKPYLIESIDRVRSFDPDSHVLARNMSYYAKYLFNTGEQEAAIELLNQSTEIAEKRGHQFTVMIIQDLRHEYNSIMGNFMDAFDATLIRLQSAHDIYGRNHSRVSLYLQQLADLLSFMGQTQMAQEVWQHNIEHYLGSETAMTEELANTYAFMGLDAWYSDQNELAVAYWQKSHAYASGVQAVQVLGFVIGEGYAIDSEDTTKDESEELIWQMLLNGSQEAEKPMNCPDRSEVLSLMNLRYKYLLLEACSTSDHDLQTAYEAIKEQQKLAQQAFGETHKHQVVDILDALN